MFHRLLTTAGVAAAVAFVVGGGAFAIASGSEDGQAESITVIEKTTSQHFVDVGKAGFSIGDEFFFNSEFWNADQTQQVGSNHGYCVLLTARLAHCAGTGRLFGRGTVEYAGNVKLTASDLRIAITGGTGGLKHAEGQVLIHNLNADGTLSRDVIELVG